MRKSLSIAAGLAAFALASQAWALQTWTVGSSYGTISSGVTVSGVSNTGGTDGLTSSANNAATQTIQSATWVNTWGGIGNADSGTGTYNDNGEGVSPEHAIDNDQRYDMALLSFGTTPVKLSSVRVGWAQGDADISVLAYTGSSAPLIGLKYNQLVANGWTVVGTYQNSAAGNVAINSTANVFGSYWLIGAANKLATGETKYANATTTNIDTSFDYLKLASVTGCIQNSTDCKPTSTTPSSVPEPGTLALFGLAVAGMAVRRKFARA